MQGTQITAGTNTGAVPQQQNLTAEICRTRIQIGRATITAFGRKGAAMLAEGQRACRVFHTATRQWSPDAVANVHVMVADPFERGVTESVSHAVQLARAQGLKVYVVLQGSRPGAPRYGRVNSEARFLRNLADRTIAAPLSPDALARVWDELLEPFSNNPAEG